MFLISNNEVIWRLKWSGHGIIHVSVIVRLASPRVNEPYAHQFCACDSRNYRSPAYGGFTWEIYVAL